jgi:hypothetical protein
MITPHVGTELVGAALAAIFCFSRLLFFAIEIAPTRIAAKAAPTKPLLQMTFSAN